MLKIQNWIQEWDKNSGIIIARTQKDSKLPSHVCFSSKTSSAWCLSAVTDMSGVRTGPRASPSVVTRVSTARVWAQTRVTASRALEERTARNVRILTTSDLVTHGRSYMCKFVNVSMFSVFDFKALIHVCFRLTYFKHDVIFWLKHVLSFF